MDEEKILDILNRIEQKVDLYNLKLSQTGVVRKCDELGRMCLPAHMRQAIGLEGAGNIQLVCHDNKIIIQKAEQ